MSRPFSIIAAAAVLFVAACSTPPPPRGGDYPARRALKGTVVGWKIVSLASPGPTSGEFVATALLAAPLGVSLGGSSGDSGPAILYRVRLNDGRLTEVLGEGKETFKRGDRVMLYENPVPGHASMVRLN